jgi:hypothetical protein
MMNTNELEKNRLLTKKDFESFFEEHGSPRIDKTNINELRSTFGVTHLIDGQKPVSR